MTEKENTVYKILLTPIKCDKNIPKICLKDTVIYSPQLYKSTPDEDMSDFSVGFYKIVYKDILGGNNVEILTSQKTLTEFDKDIFESIVEKIIVGGINSDGEIDPAMLTIIFKTGASSTKDAKSYKSKRKNAKIENDKLCFNAVTDDEKKCTNKENSARRVCEFVSETQLNISL